MAPNPSPETGILYIVATPIGNLEDITLRALRILGEADIIACEDTRHTRRLLDHFQITTPTISYYREKEKQRAGELLKQLQTGRTVALVSDAGTPAISDPGSILVNAARAAGIQVVPLPGPSALVTCISVAGLSNSSFLFLGFPPAKKAGRRRLFTSLSSLPQPLVLYESPHRISGTVADLLQQLGDRRCLFCRELTKIHEEIRETTLSSLAEDLSGKKVKGEIVLLLFKKNSPEQPDSEDMEELLHWYHGQGISLKQAVRDISRDLGLKRTPVYRQALSVWHSDE